MQSSGPWDLWVSVVENTRLVAQRTVRPPKVTDTNTSCCSDKGIPLPGGFKWSGVGLGRGRYVRYHERELHMPCACTAEYLDPPPPLGEGAKAQNQEALSLALRGRTGRTGYEPNGTMHGGSGHMWS